MLQELLTKNFGWKLLSLALAVVIWLSVRTVSSEQGNSERMYIDLPIQLLSGTADVRSYGLEPDHVRVTLKGPREVFKKVNEREIRVFVDITSLDSTTPFEHRVDASVPAGLSIVRIEPPAIQVIPPLPSEPTTMIGEP